MYRPNLQVNGVALGDFLICHNFFPKVIGIDN